MNFVEAVLTMFVDLVASTDAILGGYVDMPANASGPLDPSITLTSLGSDLVSELVRLAEAWSGTIAMTLKTLI